MRVLVVYYSRAGHTQRLAQWLTRELDGVAMAIDDQGPVLALTASLRARVQGLLGRGPVALPTQQDPARYDLVLLGVPVLDWRLAAPVRGFARAWRNRLPQVAFFATTNGHDHRPALDALQRLLGQSPQAELVINAQDIGELHSERCRARLLRFVERLRRLPCGTEARAA